MWRQTVESLVRFVWPGRCGGCGGLLMPNEALFCELCEAEVRECGAFDAGPEIDAAFACFYYDRVLSGAVKRWKYQGSLALGRALAQRLAASWARPEEPARVLIPVPLHARRLKERGFDQTRFLARALSRASQHTLNVSALRKIRPTAPQASLSELVERRVNLEGAFALHQVSGIEGRACVLVDDVVTTGTTARACARLLREGGAERVEIVALTHRS